MSLFYTADAPKSAVSSRAEKRKLVLQNKKVERESYCSAVCGFLTEQRIDIEVLNISKKT